MKKITLQQAIKFIKSHFNRPIILKKWSTKEITEVLFEADGQRYELLSNSDAIFTIDNPFTIYTV